MANAKNNKSIAWSTFKTRYPLVKPNVLVKVVASGNNTKHVEKAIKDLPNKPGKPRYSHSYLCNLNAVSSLHKGAIVPFAGKDVPYSVINYVGLTLRVRCYHGVAEPVLPSRGQTVDITTRELVDKDGVLYEYTQNKENSMPLEIVGLPLVIIGSYTLNQIEKASSDEWDDMEDEDVTSLLPTEEDDDEEYDDDNDGEEDEPQYQITRRGKSKGLTSIEDVTDIQKALKLKHIELV